MSYSQIFNKEMQAVIKSLNSPGFNETLGTEMRSGSGNAC